MRKRPYIFTLLIVLGMLMAGGITTAEAPIEEDEPETTALPVSEGEKMHADAQVYQTMYFLRCGHSVSRRTGLSDAVKTEDFASVRAYYDLWTVLEMTADHVEMERQLDLYCPMHQVVSLNETGQVVLSENRYGDGMAVKKVYAGSIDAISEETREKLLAGQGFDSEQDANAWLEEMGILP